MSTEPWVEWHRKNRPCTTRPPLQATRKSGVTTPSSSAAIAIATLKVDPGEYLPCSARWFSGRSLSRLSRPHVSPSMPRAKTFGIVGGSANKGEDLARTRIQEHRRTVEPGVAECVLRRLLQIVVEGELDLPALERQPLVEDPDLPADVVDDDPPRAVAAHQQPVVGAFDAGLADDRAAAHALELRRRHLGFADLADVAEDVRGHLAGRIEPDGKLLHVDSRKLPGMRGDRRHLVERGVANQDHRPEGRVPPVPFHDGPELRQGHAGQIGKKGHRALEVLGLLAGQRDVERIAVLGQHAAISVQHRAPRRAENQGALVIVLRMLAVLVVLDDLQPPEPDRKAGEHEDDTPPPHRQQNAEAVARPLQRARCEPAGHVAHRLGLYLCSASTRSTRRGDRPATAHAGAAVRPRPESSAAPPPPPDRRRCWQPPASADRAG